MAAAAADLDGRTVAELLRLARREALRLTPPAYRTNELDDVIQDGLIGALYAARTYDPARGEWESYCVWQIRMGILKGRHRRTGFRRGQHLTVRLSLDHLTRSSADGDDPWEPAGDPSDDPESRTVGRCELDDLLGPLTPRDRAIVLGRAVGLTQSETARQVGLSQVHVSRILAAARRRGA